MSPDVVAAWFRLPEAIKAGILAMVKAAPGPDPPRPGWIRPAILATESGARNPTRTPVHCDGWMP